MFLVVTKYACLGALNSTRSCHEPERLALLEFKHSVKDKYEMLSSWVGSDCCSWKGVRCDGATGSVVSLLLKGNYYSYGRDYLKEEYYLVGDKVNASLAELRHLQHLDLSSNNFKGSQIPKFIGSFKQLSYLNLSNACFNGIIPHHIGNLSNLKVLDLASFPYSDYMLSSNDIAWVSRLSSLEHLDLSSVNLSQSKNVDMVFYMIPSLTYLSLQLCELSNVDLHLHLNSSKILPNIEHLDLSSNLFQGQLPHFFQNKTVLTFLDLSGYDLSLAQISVNQLIMIPSLSELHLSGCGLHSALFSPTYFNSSAHSHIQYLDLSANSIKGRIPYGLMNITSLKVLDLSSNSLNLSIPVIPNLLKLDVSYNKFEHVELVGIWRQCHLKKLRLSENYFGGEMWGPSSNTSECSHYALEVLELYDNKLNGPIPESIGKLNNLRVLILSSNQFTGSIPKALERLRSLEVLVLSKNGLTGPVPSFLGKLTKLDLSYNQLSGSIPESLGRLTGLTLLRLASNLLTGPIPVSIGQLNKLTGLVVSNNSLEGVVTEAHFANLSMLKLFNTFANHKLIFNLSNEWMPPFQLKYVKLSSCKIVNGFPQWLQNRRKLDTLVLSNASLYGLLPTWLRNMSMLYTLDISHNKLTGSLINLPFSEYTMYLLLQDNLFKGSIPRSVCKTTGLGILDVSSNRLSGNIPDCLENLQYIQMLILNSNGLSGVLPSSLGNNHSSLKWLKLNDNNFNGQIPLDLRNLTSLEVLDLGNNDFSGNIPKWIGEKLSALRIFRLHKNNFIGSIPHSLCKCSSLQILDVSTQQLNRINPSLCWRVDRDE
ncbi:hypothetical protein M8C21_028940 [Ambrosia artemisiifolia]|uniref:Leucine-rich repeat-containing N-terminal plant-type domain-containing protein n=1 Tax=Ambrosia artemisiifolia TaxID=4212 RepID=A0AAD5D0F9_AMBAR|nr:hypothetical protein M8C21_028940 [Ambrosia artemisiifolia]